MGRILAVSVPLRFWRRRFLSESIVAQKALSVNRTSGEEGKRGTKGGRKPEGQREGKVWGTEKRGERTGAGRRRDESVDEDRAEKGRGGNG